MANEIYHRSNWGNAVNDNAWGDVYEKFDATNEMFVRSDNYENSNETDKLMAAINPKPSILLTPTAYDNGSLHSVKPVLSPFADFDFTRGTIATRVNEQGLIEDVTDTNLPRIDYTDGTGSLLLEPQSTNLFLNSVTLSTQGVTTSAASHTVSFYGTGSITFSGTHSATLNGTGANNRVSLTFTPSSGTLTCTVSGLVTNAQIEALSFATSYIPTSGSTVTRNKDVCVNAGSSDLISSTEGVLYAEIAALGDDLTKRFISISDGSNDNTVRFQYNDTSNTIRFQIRVSGSGEAAQSFSVTNIKDFHKVAISYKLNDVKFFIDGVKVGTDTSAAMPTGLNELSFIQGVDSLNFFGNLKCVAVYKEALTDAQLTALTT